MSPEWIPRLVIAVILFLLLLSLRRRREAIRDWLLSLIKAEAAYIGVIYLFVRMGRTTLESLLAGVLVGLIVIMRHPARSRHVPAALRRRKVTEWELKHGRKFNPQKYELDHDIPFARGGSHAADNLRVVERRKNRSKGKKSPWWDLIGR